MKLIEHLKDLFNGKKFIPNVLKGRISFETYRYHLLSEKGFPESCLREPERQLVEKFGYTVLKELDWVLLRKYPELITKTLLSDDFDKNCPKVNTELYRRTIDFIKPCDFNRYMAILYPDRIFEMEDNDPNFGLKTRYNRGQLSLREIVLNWDILKEKKLSLCLRNASKKDAPLPGDEILKKLMSQYGENLRVIAKYNPSKFYDFYCEIGKEIEDKNMLGLYRTLKTTSDETLDRISEGHQYVPNKDYNTLFKYSSLEEYMKKKKVNPYLIIKFSSQLEGIPDKKEFMSNLPFDYGHLFSNSDLIVLLNVGLEEAANTFKYQKEVHGQSDSRIFRMVRKSANVGGSNEYYK